jgi:hypothetical protein
MSTAFLCAVAIAALTSGPYAPQQSVDDLLATTMVDMHAELRETIAAGYLLSEANRRTLSRILGYPVLAPRESAHFLVPRETTVIEGVWVTARTRLSS